MKNRNDRIVKFNGARTVEGHMLMLKELSLFDLVRYHIEVTYQTKGEPHRLVIRHGKPIKFRHLKVADLSQYEKEKHEDPLIETR